MRGVVLTHIAVNALRGKREERGRGKEKGQSFVPLRCTKYNEIASGCAGKGGGGKEKGRGGGKKIRGDETSAVSIGGVFDICRKEFPGRERGAGRKKKRKED